LTLDSREIIANGNNAGSGGPGDCLVRSAEFGVRSDSNSAPRIPHSALNSLFLHGESENGPVLSGTYGLRLFPTCILQATAP